MAPLRKVFSLAGLFAAALAMSCSKDDSDVQQTIKLTNEVDRICDSFMNATGVPGMVVGIWSADKNFSYLKAKGVGNKTGNIPMSALSPFRIGSNTKTFVVTTFLQLVDERKVFMDDTLGRFFPGFTNGKKITMEMLTNMTSGIPDYTANPEFWQSIEQNPLRQWSHQELVDLAASQPDSFHTPGQVVSYCNTNTILLGLIIEKITGKPLEDNVKERIFDKIHIRKTLFPYANYYPVDGIRGYMNFTDSTVFNDDVSTKYDVSWAWAAGSMISNVEDTRDWVRALVKGDLLSADLQQARFRGNSLGNAGTYAVGMFSYGHDMWGHNGGLPGYTSIMMHHRTKDITYVIFFNWQNPEVRPDNLYPILLNKVNPGI